MLHLMIYSIDGMTHGTIYEEFSIEPRKRCISITVKDGVEFDYGEVRRVGVYSDEKLIETIVL